MIDIHVLTHSGTDQSWLEQCLLSLEGHPCVVHVVKGVEGSVGAGRATGFALGVHEFVGYVDSDDYVLPGHYAECLRNMGGRSAVVGREWVEYASGRRHSRSKGMHNGAVYRRDSVIPLLGAMLEAPLTVDMLTREVLRPKQLNHVGYVWRNHGAGAHKQIDRELAAKERESWLLKAPL